MTTETYTVVIRSSNSTAFNRIGGSHNDGTYRVDWNDILPRKYQKFRLKTQFRSASSNDIGVGTEDFVFIESNTFPRQGFYDNIRANSGNIIGFAYNGLTYAPSSAVTTNNESPEITVGYPTENSFNIRLTNLTGGVHNPSRIANWVLFMTFTPVTV